MNDDAEILMVIKKHASKGFEISVTHAVHQLLVFNRSKRTTQENIRSARVHNVPLSFFSRVTRIFQLGTETLQQMYFLCKT